MKRSKLEESINKAVDYLVSHDVLVSDSSPQPRPWKPNFQYKTTFVPSLILQSVSHLPHKKLTDFKKNLYEAILDQKSEHWSFNYWNRDSPEAKLFPYPDDLDDTFCALIALYSQQHEQINQHLPASLVKILLAAETKPGGPYRTWLASPDSTDWQDVDIAVNANIAYFLQLFGSPLPSLATYLAEQIAAKQFASPYYPSVFPILYYLARVCPVDSREILTKIVLAQSPTNSLELALTICALNQLGAPSPRLIRQLLDAQQPSGGWPAEAFCLDPTRNDTAHYHGSSSLTTAFALEALHKASATLPAKKPLVARNLHQKIINQANADIKKLPSDIRRQATTMLAFMDKPEIVMLPHLFAQSLAKPAKLEQKMFVQLGLANLYGWIAYTIYDDFLDEEGQLPQLSVANWAMRNSLLNFRAVPNEIFQKEVWRTFDTIDAANTWEVSHCRWPVMNNSLQVGKMPSYGERQKLAERSLGHSLTPLAILIAAGYKLDDPAAQQVQAAFRHYLIARQLDDDSHDWQTDVANGHISYVVSVILRDLGYNRTTPFKTLIPAMQKQFWHHSLPKICATMQVHIDAGRAELNGNSALLPNNLLKQLFDGIETSVKVTLNKQEQARTFLTQYQKGH